MRHLDEIRMLNRFEKIDMLFDNEKKSIFHYVNSII